MKRPASGPARPTRRRASRLSSGEAPRDRREAQAEETRALLARTALALFAKQGYVATSTRQVAQEAGVSEGLIFHHFPTKLDLLLHIAAQHRLMAHRVSEAIAEGEGRPVGEIVSRITGGFVALMSPRRPETQLFRVLLGESLTTPELGAIFRRLGGETTGAIADLLRRRAAIGELRADLDPQTAAAALMGPLLWFFLGNQHLSAPRWRAEAAAFAERFTDQWLSGVAPRP